MVADILIVISLVLAVVTGVKRGIARALLGFACVIAASLLAGMLSGGISSWIYDTFMADAVRSNIEELIGANGAAYALENSLEALPGWIQGIIDFIANVFGADSSGYQLGVAQIADYSEAFAPSALSAAIEQAISPVAKGILEILVYVLLLILFCFLLKFFTRKLLFIFEVPVIRQINHIFGGVFGAAEGIVVVFIAVNLFCSICAAANPSLLEEPSVRGALFNLFSVSC